MDARRSGKSYVGAAALVVALAALTLAVFAVFYQRQVRTLDQGTESVNKQFTGLTGLLNQKASNALDPRYTDADGDLVADAPTDPAKQLDPPTLTFSYLTTTEDEPGFQAAFKEFLAAVGNATGKPVKYVNYASVTDQMRAMRDGKLTMAGLNTGAVPFGVCTAGFVPLCQAADADGAAEYHMEIIVPGDSTLARLSDLKGHELTLTDPNSNSGYKAPLVILRENGMVPPTDYLIRYSQGHVQSIAGIKQKRFEAAAVAGDVLSRAQNSGQIAAGDYKVIYTSDQTFPDAAIGCANNLKPDLVAKIRDTALHFDWKGTGLEKLFAAEGKVKFVPADYKKNWQYVRRIDESIGYAYSLPAGPAPEPTTLPTTVPATASVGD
jgi:phosphonate transport system substrate-binding protein